MDTICWLPPMCTVKLIPKIYTKRAEVFVRGGVELSKVICQTVRGSRSEAKRVFFAAF